MATTVDTILVKVEADLKDVNRKLQQLEKNTSKTTKSVEKGFGNIGRSLKTFAVAYASILATRGVLATAKFGSSVEEMEAKASAVFKRFLPTVRTELDDFGEAAGRSTVDLLEMATSVQDLLVPLGFARGDAARLSVDLTKLASDVASFNNMADTDVLNNFRSGLVGNHEVLYRFGVVINEASLKAELFRMGISKSIDEVTAAEKAQARLNLILAGTTDAQGDAIRTARSLANETKGMFREFDRLWLLISRALAPAFLLIVRATRAVTKAIVEDAIPAVRKFGLTIIESINFGGVFDQAIEDHKRLTNSIKNQIKSFNREDLALQGGEVIPQQDPLALKRAELVRDQANEIFLLQERLGGATEADLKFTEANMALGRQFGDTTQNIFQQTQALAELEQRLQEQENTQQAILGSLEGLSAGFSETLAESMLNGKLALDDFKDVARSFVSTLIKEFIRLEVINRILNSVFGLQGQNALPTGNILSSNATGGRAQGGVPTLVGERGPEIIIPHTASTVMNSNNTRSALGGGGGVVVNQSINVSTGVSQTVRAELLNFLPVIQSQTLNAVAQAKSKGGRMAEVL